MSDLFRDVVRGATPRPLLAALLAAGLAASLTGTARAEEPADNVKLFAPTLEITMTRGTGGAFIRVCTDGTALVPGSWAFGVNGVRSDGTQVTGGGGSAPVGSFHACIDVPKRGTPYGSFAVYFAYQGGSGTAGTVRPGAVTGAALWRTGAEDVYLSTGGG